MDGTAVYHIKRKDRPGIVRRLRLFPEDALTLKWVLEAGEFGLD